SDMSRGRGFENLNRRFFEASRTQVAFPHPGRVAVAVGEHGWTREAPLVHALGAVGTRDSGGLGEDKDATTVEPLTHHGAELLPVAEPGSTEDRVNHVVRLRVAA